jgi:hypothetical protein
MDDKERVGKGTTVLGSAYAVSGSGASLLFRRHFGRVVAFALDGQ